MAACRLGLGYYGMGQGGDPANEANLYDGHCLLHIWSYVNLSQCHCPKQFNVGIKQL